MITIWKKMNENNWQLIEELQDHSGLAERLSELRQDGEEYRAEKKDSLASTILDA